MAKFVAEKVRQRAGNVAKTAAKGERSSAVHGRKIPCLSLFRSRRGRTESRESLTRRGLSAWSSAALFLKSLFFSLLAGNRPVPVSRNWNLRVSGSAPREGFQLTGRARHQFVPVAEFLGR